MAFNTTTLTNSKVTQVHYLIGLNFRFISICATALRFNRLRPVLPDELIVNQLISNSDGQIVADVRRIPLTGESYMIYFPTVETYTLEIVIPEHYESVELLIQGISGLISGTNTGNGNVDLSNYYDKAEISELLAGKALLIHAHSQYALQTALAALETTVSQLQTSNYTQADSDLLYPSNAEFDTFVTAVDSALLSKSDSSHVHDNLYYTKSQVFTKDEVNLLIAAIDGGGNTANQFTFQHPNDQAGLFFYLGTNQYTNYWTNPHISGKIAVNSSGLGSGSHADIVNRVTNENVFTNPTPNPWVSVDLIDKEFVLAGYTVGQRFSDNNALRHWKFQGSDDNANWIDLDEFRYQLKGSEVIYRPASNSSAFRFFRLYMASQSSTSDWYLCLAELELYGSIA